MLLMTNHIPLSQPQRTVRKDWPTLGKMSFNMSAMRASVGSISLRQPARLTQRPVSLALPLFSGLSVSGRLSVGEECECTHPHGGNRKRAAVYDAAVASSFSPGVWRFAAS